MYALQRTMQKCHIPVVSRTVSSVYVQYQERASSSTVHVCASMWVPATVKPSRGQCYLLHYTKEVWDFSFSTSSLGFLVLLYIAPWSDSGELNSWEDLVSVTTGYRYSSSFMYKISWAELGTWKVKKERNRQVVKWGSIFIPPVWNVIKHWYCH